MTRPKYELGLVLSGGAVRGVAHAGVLEVLLENGIVPDIVAGVSAGALVGALYAAKYPPQAIKGFFENAAIFDRKALDWGRGGIIDPMAFEETFQGYWPPNSFEALDKPFKLMATNLLTGEGRVYEEGELVKPLLASCAVPGLFTPVEMEEAPYGDGGIYTNFPVELIRSQCRKCIGVYVHPMPTVEAKSLRTPWAVLGRAYEISRTAAVQYRFPECDYVLIPDGMEDYSLYDLESIDQMYDLGKQATEAKLEAIQAALG